jgi:hypothetical protein
VLEEVRHAGLAVVLVAAADEVRDVHGDGGLGLIREQQDLRPLARRYSVMPSTEVILRMREGWSPCPAREAVLRPQVAGPGDGGFPVAGAWAKTLEAARSTAASKAADRFDIMNFRGYEWTNPVQPIMPPYGGRSSD